MMTPLFRLYILVILFICYPFLIKAQETIKIPDILPPSPNAFAITRYGGIDLGMQTGTAQFNVPLYTLAVRNLSVPVSLSYSSNGIKVDEIASRVGTTWSLIAGGVITRTLHDKPDETSTHLSPPANFDPGTPLYDYLQATTTNLTDEVPDVFSFNFNGQSGQFIIDGNRIVQLTKTNLKIEFSAVTGNNFGATFRITTPNGIAYYFGGVANSVESSSDFSLGEEGCGKSNNEPINNAWYLSKITNPEGDFISFEYEALTPYSYPVSISQTKTRSLIGLQHCPTTSGTVTIDDTNCENLITTNSVYLKKIITSDNHYITFSYIDRQDLTYDKLLSSITIFQNGNSNYLKSFNLNYQNATATSYLNPYSNGNAQLKVRPFLVGITESASGTTEKHFFSFDYNNIGALPPRLSYSQDHYGYFNGASNGGLIPTPALTLTPFFPDATANRSSVFEYAQIGMLKKINYPTGGSDSIAYKAPTYSVIELPDPVPQMLYVSGVGADLSTPVTTNSSPITITNNAQIAELNATFTFQGPPEEQDFHAQSYIYLINTANNQAVYTGFLNADNRQLHDFLGLGTGGTYILRCVSYGQYSRLDAGLKYFTQGAVPIQKNKVAGGVVVDFVKTYDPVKQVTNLKKYYYSALNDLSWSSGSLAITPIYMADFYTARVCSSPNGNPPIGCGTVFQFKQMSSNSMTNLYGYSQHNISFQTVIESEGDNFANGGIEHVYRNEPNTPGEIVKGVDILTSPLTNGAVGRSGQEIFTNYFIKSGSTFKTVKQIRTTYKEDNRLSELFYGYTVRQRYVANCGPPSSTWLDAFDIKRNYIFSRWTYVDTVETKIFGIPGGNPTVETNVFSYDNTAHLLPTKKTIIRSNGKKGITQYKYPGDFLSTAPYDAMFNTLHIWSPVVEQSDSIYDPATSATTFLRATKTDFQVWNGSSNIIHPATISTKSGTDAYEPRIQFQNYDDKGYPTSVSNANGPKINYVYSYGGSYPVAQITNADYSQVVAALGGSTAVASLRNNLTPSDSQLANLLAVLRTSPLLANAQVITYTYSPQIGITSITDPKGLTNYYEYDNFQRLLNIKDRNGNIIKNYQYNYAHELIWNDEQFGYFTKTCTTGTGSSVKYTVPAHTYSAETSIAANALATADVTANGQAYADSHGTCQVLPYAQIVQTLLFTDGNGGQNTAKYSIRLFADNMYTIPFTAASNIIVNYRVRTSTSVNNGTPSVVFQNRTATVLQGANSVVLGFLNNGCGSGGVVNIASGGSQQQTANGGATTNLLPPPGGGGDTTCITDTLLLLEGTGYIGSVVQ